MQRKSRKTKQKELIDRTFEKIKGFFSADSLYDKVRKEDKEIGIATIYRFLKDLKKKNKIYSYTCEKKTLYSKEKNSHCHYVCEKTGKVTHFDIDNVDFLSKVKEMIPGSITSFQLEVIGVCDSCKE